MQGRRLSFNSQTQTDHLRVITDAPGEAAWNMAVDGALLALAEQPTLRIYGWQPHAVSIGYFQSLADFLDLPSDTPIVRRSTGGGAIHHGDELTFSLALPAAKLPKAISESYANLHDAIVRALTEIGVKSRRASAGHQPSARPKERWCFACPVQDDLVTDEGKLLGSAQRRTNAKHPRVLHHGSLVLQRPTLTPFVAAVADQKPVTEQLRDDLANALVSELAKVLDLASQPGSLSQSEHAMATQLCKDRYQNEDYLNRR